MTGIEQVVDESGEKTAVLIDLKEHGAFWEGLYDALIAAPSRAHPHLSAFICVHPRLHQHSP